MLIFFFSQRSQKSWLLGLFVFCFTLSLGSEKAFAAESYHSFSVKDLKNGDVSLSKFKGKKVFIDFWATWCPPCRRQLIIMDNFLSQKIPQDWVFLFISLDSHPDLAKKYINSHHPDLKNNSQIHVLFDEGSQFSGTLGVQGIPALFFLGKDGSIQWRHTGLASVEDIKSAIAQT